MKINSFPPPRLLNAIRPTAEDGWGAAGKWEYFPSGTEAIYWACRGMGATEGKTIWMPTFNCGVEVAAALRAGMRVKFYPIGRDLAIDEAWLSDALRREPAPVLAIHYFGFAQPALGRLAALCEELRQPLIADCAHALATRRDGVELWREAPLAVLSFHKFIGLFDGGALVIDEAAHRRVTGRDFQRPPQRGQTRGPYVMAAKHLARSLVGDHATQLYRRLRYGRRREVEGDGKSETRGTEPEKFHDPEGLLPACFGREISWISRRMLWANDINWIVQRRRQHYQRLARMLEGVEGYEPAFYELGEGTCPLGLPIRVARRRELMATLARAGIKPFIFGEHAHPLLRGHDFPDTRALRGEIVGLPVHQELTNDELMKIGETLRGVLPAHAIE